MARAFAVVAGSGSGGCGAGWGRLLPAMDARRSAHRGAAGAGIYEASPDGNAGAWAGCIAWRSLAVPELDGSWEVKRLWVRPGARGSGAGRGLVEAVEALARSAGKSSLVLDTAPDAMPAAYRLYLELGF